MKKLIVLMILGSCGLPPSCYISERDMDACTRMCIPAGVRTYNETGCHCNTDIPKPDGGW